MPVAPKKTPARKPARRKHNKIVRVSVKYAGLFPCKTCGKRYTLPWRHVCVLELSEKRAAAARRNLEAARKAKQRKGGK